MEKMKNTKSDLELWREEKMVPRKEDTFNYGSAINKIEEERINFLDECIIADTRVIIPDGITEIPEYAFGECEFLKSVIIPDSVDSENSDY
jgi:hypothetical protein